MDATDGDIVIFQARGSLVARNVIRSETRVMYYGISMVDFGPFDGDFTGTRVIGNTLDASGALMRRAIDTERPCHDGDNQTARGASAPGSLSLFPIPNA